MSRRRWWRVPVAGAWLACAAWTSRPVAAVASDERPARPGPPTDDASDGTGSRVAWPTIELLDGTVWTPESWRGTAAVLVLWATWCPYCVRHNPRIDALHRAAAGRPLRVLGASLDRDPELVRRHVRQHGYAFPITMQGEALRERFGLRRITPTTVTVDRRGAVVQRIPGEMADDDVRGLIRLADGAI